jgi:uncharacterized coiled-coil protein SlyX
VAIAVFGWIWVNRQSPPSPAQAPPPVSSAESPTFVVDPEQTEQLLEMEVRLRQAERRVVDQRDEIDELERQLEEARADAELHKRGLERAVAELNRINEDLDNLASAAQALPRPAVPSPPVERVRPLGAPFVTTTLSGYVVASGLVHNPTKYPARGTLEVSLVGSDGVMDTRGFGMSVGAGETERYDITFTHIFPTESLGAKARWVE